MEFPLPLLHFLSILSRDRFLWESAAYDGWFAIVLLEGRFTVEMTGRCDTAEAGDVVFFPPNVSFHRQILAPIRFLYVHFSWMCGAESYDWAARSPEETPCGRLAFADPSRRDDDIQFLLHAADRIDPDTLRRAEHYFRDLWYEANRLRFREESLSPERVADEKIRKAMLYIAGHYGERLQVGALAAACNMTHAHFTNRFLRAAGMTPIAYIRQIRLGSACLLMNKTEMTLGQIATLCGYENPFYFSRCFSAVYGMSPSAWREKNRI